MTVAAIGLNLTLGYAGQISLAQAAFVGIGAYLTAWLTTQGLVVLANSGVGGRCLLRHRLAPRLSGAAPAAPLSRLRDAGVQYPRLSRVSQRGMAHRGHLRHLQRATSEPRRLVAEWPARILLLLPRLPGTRVAGDVVADSLAMGPRVRGAARKPDACAVARRRHAPLHADGVRARRRARRRLRRALCPARAVHRSHAVRARACRSICC